MPYLAGPGTYNDDCVPIVGLADLCLQSFNDLFHGHKARTLHEDPIAWTQTPFDRLHDLIMAADEDRSRIHPSACGPFCHNPCKLARGVKASRARPGGQYPELSVGTLGMRTQFQHVSDDQDASAIALQGAKRVNGERHGTWISII